MIIKRLIGCLRCVGTPVLFTAVLAAQSFPPITSGPYNGEFLPAGLGHKSFSTLTLSGRAWSITSWVNPSSALTHSLIGGFGDTRPDTPQEYLAIENGHAAVWLGGTTFVSSSIAVPVSAWHFLAAVSDGTSVTLYIDGNQVATGPLPSSSVPRTVIAAPEPLPSSNWQHFSGLLANFTVHGDALTPEQVNLLGKTTPNAQLIVFDTPSHAWPVQTHAQAGYRSPQAPDTLPKSSVPPSEPVVRPITDLTSTLEPRANNEWAIVGGWSLATVADTSGDGTTISSTHYRATKWLHATVPGTVLTTYIDRGIYPDPAYGLNNLAIPEKLSRQDYWYRVELNPPGNLRHHHLTLTFNGINYAAEVWLNGSKLGNVKGAFIRGVFDVSEALLPGQANVLAVRISPPPHPGIPEEQSVKAGPGENGGIMCLDGPTFVATEGWDWIPGLRDRNSGIWQDVTLTATDDVRIGDPRVITDLPLPDITRADVYISVPLHNDTPDPVSGDLEASFEGVTVKKHVTLEAGESIVRLAPTEFHQLEVDHPRLWWPNGYGRPDLYHLKVAFHSGSHDSDTKTLRFGIREITYELSLVDTTGNLRRVEVSPTLASGQPIVNVTHEGMIQSAAGWVASLLPAAENSPAVRPDPDTGIAPYLAIKVNGVRIACKGGNWGMDDYRKRVSREHLEPFFRLHRDAHLNIIRNWVGQDTEETFYDLADEYGLLVWNDFWDSTENYNLEPDDSALFLKNARDVILRFRNHPSIAIWCGRNEGVPAPAVNRGLDELVRTLDGTRYYSPSSNSVNLQFSGPYHYEAFSKYFTDFARGFAVELGVPSFPTVDSFNSFVAPQDRWPPNDVWAYHDWHASGNGDTKPFMEALAQRFGEAKDLDDFNRKAQMMDYEAHRAIFEGFNAHLWNPNSGRMLWMTQPAWPSTMWQILSYDYDTQSSYYGVKKGSEMIHVQMNLPDLVTAAVNETAQPVQATLRAQMFSRAGASIFTHEQSITIPASSELNAFPIQVPADAASDVVFIKLELVGADGAVLSQNFYWQAAQPVAYQQLNSLAAAAIAASAKESGAAGETHIAVDLTNQSPTVALMVKLTLRNAQSGDRVLPVYYEDNYVSLAPGEKRTVQVSAPTAAATGALSVGLTGWNVTPANVPVTQ